jgi:GT2 family glycosyltransferase
VGATQAALAARRSTLLEVGALDESFRRGAEWDLAVRLALMGGHFIAVNEPLVVQRKTLTPDKGGDIPLKYTLQLREKYREYLGKRHVYSASVAITRSRFHYARAERARSYGYLALACLYAPTTVLPNELRKWARRNSRARLAGGSTPALRPPRDSRSPVRCCISWCAHSTPRSSAATSSC